MRKVKMLIPKPWLTLMLMPMLLLSCGIMDFEESGAVTPVEMYFEQDTMYVMKGDSFNIKPVFTPDSITLTDIYWISEYDSIVHASGNTFIAMNTGWSRIVGTSVSRQATDTCQVCVLDWNVDNLPVYPYETIIYADVNIGDIEFDSQKMALAAYVSDRLCGVGIAIEKYGIKYIQIRVGSNIFDDDDYSSMKIKFCLLNTKEYTCREINETVVFDCETHGSLNNLFKFTLQ